MIRIAATQYTLLHRCLEIYLAGCKADPHCKDCHNPELWSFDVGEPYNDALRDKIKNKVLGFEELIDKIWILGGEPMDNDTKELEYLLRDLKELNVDIWLWTRYDLYDVPGRIEKLCSYIKTGRYIPELHTEDNIQYGVKLESSNQNIYKVKK